MKSSLKSSLVSRSALLRSLALGTVFTATRRPAIAAYTIVPTGSVRDKTARLAEVEKLYAKTPDDPYAFGEKAQLEYDIRQLEQNTKFVASTREQVRAGSTRFLQRLRVPVDDMREAVQFWREGCGALVLSTRIVDGANVTVVGFGPESLRRDDGAKFALELVESSEPAPMGGDHALQYVQLAMPVFRLSRVMAAGGKIESAYGWTQLTAPGGLPLRVRIDESRRDPFEFVAVRVSAMGAAVEHFTRLGMAAGKPQEGRRLRKNLGLDSLLSSNSLLEESAAAARRRPPAPLAAATFGRDLQPCARRPSPAPRARSFRRATRSSRSARSAPSTLATATRRATRACCCCRPCRASGQSRRSGRRASPSRRCARSARRPPPPPPRSGARTGCRSASRTRTRTRGR